MNVEEAREKINVAIYAKLMTFSSEAIKTEKNWREEGVEKLAGNTKQKKNKSSKPLFLLLHILLKKRAYQIELNTYTYNGRNVYANK